MKSLNLFFLVLILLGGCARKTEAPAILRSEALERTAPPSIVDDGEVDSLLHSISKSVQYLSRLDPETQLSFGPDSYSVAHLLVSIRDFSHALTEYGLSPSLSDYLSKNYFFYKSTHESPLFTGYFEGTLHGSRTKSNKYHYPLYRVPNDLVKIELRKFIPESKMSGLPPVIKGRLTRQRTLEPYYSREEIDYQDVLAKEGLELVWVDDPLAAFFLHIQGSGVILLDTGEVLRANYADSNGQPYRAIGAFLLQKGLLDKDRISMQSIKAYLSSHPEELKEVLSYNPSYIFFREVPEGPIGSIGVPLTPLRSIATDSSLFPKGAPAYIRTSLPSFSTEGERNGSTPISRFVLNQDTGGAIKGTGRIDLFTGRGEQSELLAGHLKELGEIYFFVKRP